MVQFYDSISEELKAWALKQSVFFVASAPLAGRHINVSPKGLPASSLSILSPNQVAYVDANGSGCETISHVYENGRVTIMFCSFEASPRIMRFFCKGRVVEWDQPEFDILLTKMGSKRVERARAIILLHVFKAQTSCGYGVPRLAKRKAGDGDEDEWVAGFEDRETLGHWASKMAEKNELHAYRKKNNSDSLDGLTGLRAARRDNGEILWLTDLITWFRRILLQREAIAFGFSLALFLFLVVYYAGKSIPKIMAA
jgi:Pyridoxamine 5'-phosphate oxidase